MPLKAIKICQRCEKKSCDGAVWRMLSVVPTVGIWVGRETVDKTTLDTACTVQWFGQKKMRVPVGTIVDKYWGNWVDKANTKIQKIEE